MQDITRDERLFIPESMVSGRVARFRLLTGLIQGFALYFLYIASQDKLWPATQPYVFIPLLMVMVFVPVIFVSSLGHIKNSVILRWIISAGGIVCCLTVYDIWRVGFIEHVNKDAQLYPSPLLFFFVATGLFIAHALIFSAASDNRFIARYTTYFEAAWKLGIQLIFAGLFVGILWTVLWMGAVLFTLVKLDFLEKLLQKSWFAIPVSVFAFSFALHITDVRPGIVRGIRSLLLVLMSWLLPVVTLMVAGFIISLPFTGLQPLWATGNATAVLLGASAVLVILINTAFQNGEVSEQLARIIHLTARLGALLLAPLMLIAIYSLGLRVQQYGWTTDRIIAASCLLVGSCYTTGYAWAASEKGGRLSRIAPTNIAAAFLVLAVLLALFTPLADPARLSVNSQIGRLLEGKIKPAEFDYDYLKFDGARYGMAALVSLNDTWQGADANIVREKIEATQKKEYRWDQDQAIDLKGNLDNVTVWPKEAVLPVAFIEQVWNNNEIGWQIPDCMRNKGKQCDAFLVDINSDNKSEIIIIGKERYMQPQIFMQQSDASWKLAGSFSGANDQCKNNLFEALRTNSFKLVDSSIRDIEVNGRRFNFVPIQDNIYNCSDDVK